jgi:N-acetylglucosaminyl-diphospho-decaprenol L-rhamnosyltransferase
VLTSIIVVSHDSGELLLRCVAAALAQTDLVEVIVVDNASRDGAPLRLPPDQRLQVIENADNRGFGVACNQGAAVARGQMLLLLNPDCVLPTDALHHLHAIHASHPEFMLLGAQLLNSDGTPQSAARRRTPTPTRAIRRALGFRDALEIEPSEELPASSTPVSEVDAISGALMFVPRVIFDRLGGFDEGYVLHCEDLDLCRRALLAGHRIGVANGVRVTHHKGTSSRRRPVWVEWQKHRGMLRYFRKFDAAASPVWLRALVPVAVWMRFPLAALRALRRAHQR